MYRSLIRSVSPASLTTPAGYNTALLANRVDGGWARADGMFPVTGSFGVVFIGSDTLKWSTAFGGPSLFDIPRNSLINIDPSGNVWWLSSGDPTAPQGATSIPTYDNGAHWFWPTGGWLTQPRYAPQSSSTYNPLDSITVFGHLMASDPLSFYREVGVGYAIIPSITNPLSHARTPPITITSTLLSTYIDFPTLSWSGSPVRVGNFVYIPGFESSTFNQYLARYDLLTNHVSYATTYGFGESPEPLTVIGGGPLSAFNIIPYTSASFPGTRYLATAKILSSAPELGYPETPDITAWTAPNITGPYTRQATLLYTDTTRAGWFSYLGYAAFLPNIAPLCALWSRNAVFGTVFSDVDGYGVQIADANTPY